MSGVFAVSRSLFDHEVFADEPFSEREAWIWLIGEAAWKARRARAGKVMVNLARGQCAFSIRFLAEKWQWSKSKVARFLARLQHERMIGTQASTQISIITICNYDDYQKVSLPTGTQSGTQTGHARDKDKDRGIQGNISLTGREASPAPNLEKQAYDVGKELLGKQAGGVITKLVKHHGQDFAAVLSTLGAAREKSSPMEWVQGVLKGRDRQDEEMFRGAYFAHNDYTDEEKAVLMRDREEQLALQDWMHRQAAGRA